MLIVQEYDELESYVAAFAAGHLRLMLVCGPPGVGKSYAVRRAVGDAAAWVDGNATAFGVYCHAYTNLDRPIVLDDVDRFYRDRNGMRLLTVLCQSDNGSWVSWETDAKRLRTENIPRRFYTSSRVCLVTNAWDRVGPEVRALEDRGHFLVFTPSAVEVHRRVAEWYWDQEVYDAVAAELSLYVNHSFRTYIRASEAKAAGLDWRLTLQERKLREGEVVPAEPRVVLGRPPEVLKQEMQSLKSTLSLSADELRQAVLDSLKGGEL